MADLSKLRAAFTRFLRVVMISVRGFRRDRCFQQAAALTYLTIFSLPAFLALIFSVAKGFDAFGRLKEGPINGFLDRAFPPEAGEGAARVREVVDQIFNYVEQANLKLLGTAGVVFLVYATVKMLGSVERSFNEIWGVKRERTLVRKLSDYLAIVLVTPVILLVGTAFTGMLSSYDGIRTLVGGVDLQGPLLAAIPVTAICLGMTLILLTLPNTSVRLFPALVGGFVAGVSWQAAQIGFLEFQLGAARANAVFSSFAAVPLLLTWIYLSWITVFVGAEISCAVQNEHAITSAARMGTVDQRLRESVALRLAGRITAAFLAGEKAPTAVELSAEAGVAPRTAAEVLEELVEAHLLVETSESEVEGFVPARDPSAILVHDVLAALRTEPGAGTAPRRGPIDERVDEILEGFDEAMRTSRFDVSLAELARIDPC